VGGIGSARRRRQLAIPLPVKVIARLLGIPGDDYAIFKRWSDSELEPGSRMRNAMAMAAYFGRIAQERRTQGAEELITALVEAEVDRQRLEQGELLGFCVLLLVAGNETAANLIGNMLNLLAARPELWHRLREDRSLVETTIEDVLRYESPVQMLFRFVRRDTEIGGHRIFQNTSVAVSFGSANRDPAVFPNGSNSTSSAIGRVISPSGQEFTIALGAPLARVEAAVALNAMLDRYKTITPGSRASIRQHATNVVFGFTQLPLRLGRV
jgi:cytochrome P450